ncbi:MAG: FtsX-like permease family protein [Pseudomonadota bacterium]
MRALDRKMLRDLGHLKGQVLAISLVIASGVAVLVMSRSAQMSLLDTTEAYYERYAFGHVFASLTRAPDRLADRIAAIDGVQHVQTRVVRYATLDVAGFDEPITGQFVSIPADAEPILNRITLSAGRSVAPNRLDEVVIGEPFAEAHGLVPGSTFHAVLNGTRRELTVVGVGLSPEFVYTIAPGSLMPDNERFAVLWMGRKALANAFDLDNAFNNVSLTLQRGADPAAVLRDLDGLLERYGGVGAIERADQISNWFVMNEIDQADTMSRILPTIFLLVSAALTNMVLSRLIATERSQIGLMKAFGYSNLAVGWHYIKLVIVIALIGTVIGFVAGGAVGRYNTEVFAISYRFPFLVYRPSGAAFVLAAGLATLAAVAGAAASVMRAVKLPPAQAMLPPTPPAYQNSRLNETRVGRWLDQPTRIVLRNIARQPTRSAMTLAGSACCVALVVMAFQWNDSIDYLLRHYYTDVQRQDVTVGLTDPQEVTVLDDLRRLPGVLAAEPMRVVSADFHADNIVHRGSVWGVTDAAVLQPIFDDRLQRVVQPPENGVVLGTRIAEKLRVDVGDSIWVHVLDGRRPWLQVHVAGTVDVYLGMPVYISITTLNRLLRERPQTEYIGMLTDPAEEQELFQELKDSPHVAAVVVKQAGIDSFNETIAMHMGVFISIFSGFACILGFGVAYNSARISLSERGRELATLRVLGFTGGEISYILLAELAALVTLALPLGCLLGLGLTHLMLTAFDTELFRLPTVIDASTYGFAIIITLLATVAAAAIVRQRVARLDLISVLKTRE